MSPFSRLLLFACFGLLLPVSAISQETTQEETPQSVPHNSDKSTPSDEIDRALGQGPPSETLLRRFFEHLSAAHKPFKPSQVEKLNERMKSYDWSKIDVPRIAFDYLVEQQKKPDPAVDVIHPELFQMNDQFIDWLTKKVAQNPTGKDERFALHEMMRVLSLDDAKKTYSPQQMAKLRDATWKRYNQLEPRDTYKDESLSQSSKLGDPRALNHSSAAINNFLATKSAPTPENLSGLAFALKRFDFKSYELPDKGAAIERRDDLLKRILRSRKVDDVTKRLLQ